MIDPVLLEESRLSAWERLVTDPRVALVAGAGAGLVAYPVVGLASLAAVPVVGLSWFLGMLGWTEGRCQAYRELRRRYGLGPIGELAEDLSQCLVVRSRSLPGGRIRVVRLCLASGEYTATQGRSFLRGDLSRELPELECAGGQLPVEAVRVLLEEAAAQPIPGPTVKDGAPFEIAFERAGRLVVLEGNRCGLADDHPAARLVDTVLGGRPDSD